jgi:2-methylisocitrate lyase-like PEP mutase family enzyme
MGLTPLYVIGDGPVASTRGIPDARSATWGNRILCMAQMTQRPGRPLSMDGLYGLGLALLRVSRGVQP